MINLKTFFLLFLLFGVFAFHLKGEAQASSEHEINREKRILAQMLEQRYSFKGIITGSYGFLDKLIEKEDVEALFDLKEILREIEYPRSLHQYKNIYIGTDSAISTSVNINERDGIIIITGKKLNPIQIIQALSEDPSKEKKLINLENIRLDEISKKLKKYLGPDLLESFITILNTRCDSKIKSMQSFDNVLMSKKFTKMPRKIFDITSIPASLRERFIEAYQMAEKKENSTLRYQNSSVEEITLYFEPNTLEINLVAPSEEKTVSSVLNEKCELTKLMVRSFDKNIVKSIYHFDVDLNLSKKVFNNQERLYSKNNNSLKTAVAILDSGLDYNHPSVAEHLMTSSLKNNEQPSYESSKESFISDFNIKQLLNERKSKLNKKIEFRKIDIDLAKTRLSKGQDQKNEIEKTLTENDYELENISTAIETVRKTLGPLENDKLITFRLAKQNQIRELKNKIRDLTLKHNAIKNTRETNQFKLIQVNSKIESLKNLYELKLAENKNLQDELEKVVAEEIEHTKMIDIFVRGVSAWNFADNNDTPSDFWDGANSAAFLNYDHGTHVAGIILNGAENELTVFPMRYPRQPVVDINNEKDKKVYQAIDLAYKKGIRVINISMGTFSHLSKTSEEKIKYDNIARNSWKSIAQAANDFPDMLFVCASGNDGENTDIRGHYPSGFENNNILSVAAVNNNGLLAKFSNYGQNTVDIAAPGVDILSLVPNGEIGIKSGTSMASPFAARVAARIEHINPGLNPQQIKDIMGSTLKKTKELEEKTLYGGVIDEIKAIKKACSTITAKKMSLHVTCKN